MSSNVVTRINEIAAMTADMDISKTCGVGGHVLCEVSAYVKDQKLRRDMIKTGESIIEQVRRAPGMQLSAKDSHMALMAISDKLTLAKPHLTQSGTVNVNRMVNGAILRCEWLLGRNHDMVWTAANQNSLTADPNASRKPDAETERRARKVERKKRKPSGVKMKLKPGMSRRGPGPGM